MATEGAQERSRLLAEQATLRRVATLVAQGVPAEDLFSAVTAIARARHAMRTGDIRCAYRYEGCRLSPRRMPSATLRGARTPIPTRSRSSVATARTAARLSAS
jgi:hypothetical protein